MPANQKQFRGWHGDGVLCLTSETKIRTDKGFKKISKIKKGNKVLTDTNEYMRVTTTMKRFINEEIYNIELDNEQIIRITGNHRIKTKRGWVKADQLKSKDELIAL